MNQSGEPFRRLHNPIDQEEIKGGFHPVSRTWFQAGLANRPTQPNQYVQYLGISKKREEKENITGIPWYKGPYNPTPAPSTHIVLEPKVEKWRRIFFHSEQGISQSSY
jgi:hypothetical protein